MAFNNEAHEKAVAYAAVDAGYIHHSDLIKHYNVEPDGTMTHKQNRLDTLRTHVRLADFSGEDK